MRRHPLALAAIAIATILVAIGLAAGPAEFVAGTASAAALVALSSVALLALAGPVLVPVVLVAAVVAGAALWVRAGRRRVAVPV